MPPLRPDVTIVHAQRASASGDTQVWGLLGCQKEAAFAADRVIVVVEEVVPDAVIRADPNRTIIPGLIVDAVVAEPWGAHPSYVQGSYDRDNRFYLDWDPISRDEEKTQAWLRDWVYDLDGRADYAKKLGTERLDFAPAVGACTVGVRRLRGIPMSGGSRPLVRSAGPTSGGASRRWPIRAPHSPFGPSAGPGGGGACRRRPISVARSPVGPPAGPQGRLARRDDASPSPK